MDTQPLIPNSNKSLMHPDRVLSWVVLVLAILMILANVGLYYIRISSLEAGSRITQETNEKIAEMRKNSVPSDWQTYRNEELGFEVKYLKDYQMGFEANDQYNRLVVFNNDGHQSFEIRLRRQSGSLEKYFYLDNSIDSRGFLGDQPANIYKSSTGYCDGPGCGSPFIAYVAEHDNDFYHLVFYGDVVMSEIETQILSTFKFTR